MGKKTSIKKKYAIKTMYLRNIFVTKMYPYKHTAQGQEGFKVFFFIFSCVLNNL